MKKNKFLSGLSAKLALAIVALTTTMFTSCEKENIGIEVTPVNAKFIITPVVIDATTGTDVTQSAEISFSKGNGTYEGTPELASESININAKYEGMTGSASVTIPALKAGQFGAKEVTIILSENFFAQEESSNSQIETTKHSGFKDNTSDYWYYIKFPLIDVDINKLKEKNSDTVGWINVNNTNINYPYVQGKDNNYYLDHSFNKKYNEAGWVFLDYRNDKNLSNKNNILYAHSRLDKTMFGSLSKTLKSNWYNNKDNHIIRLSTETENTMWQIFSVYKIPEETYYITTNFNSDNDYQKFLNTIKERSIHNFSTNLTTDDKILTLSTCYSDTERTVVHAKLIKRSQK